jgi:Ca2+-binding EF-hand superfamily protein
LEEFEAVFLHFDRDRTNSLANVEFGAALASLGLNYEPDEMEEIFHSVSNGKNIVNFEQFIRFMVPPPPLIIVYAYDRWSYTKINRLPIKFV